MSASMMTDDLLRHINQQIHSNTIKHKSPNTIHDKYQTPRRFGTGVPSSGRLQEQKKVQHANLGIDRPLVARKKGRKFKQYIL